MRVIKDYHTHSVYSKFHHGKNTIEELVQEAIRKGLQTIAITDHAPGHPFGVWKHKLKQRKAEIEALRKKYPQIEILVGLETNLVSKLGKIDVTDEERKDLDICLMGYHKMGSWGAFGILKTLFGKNQIEKNTEAYLAAIENNKIDIITHLQQYIKVDAGRVAAAAAKKGTLIEINNRHLLWTKKDIEDMLATDCKFVIDSDAHKKQSVGEFQTAIAFAEKYNIPIERIVNAKE